MALFGLARSADPQPLVRGDGLYLRPAIAAIVEQRTPDYKGT